PCGGEDAAVDRERECDDPAGRLLDRIEGDELAVCEVRTAMTTLRCELIRFQCRVLGRTCAPRFIGRYVPEAGLRVVAHGKPRVTHAGDWRVCSTLSLLPNNALIAFRSARRRRCEGLQINLVQGCDRPAIDSSRWKDRLPRPNVECVEHPISWHGHH